MLYSSYNVLYYSFTHGIVSGILVLQNAHDNLISSMVIVGDNLFTASYSLIKVNLLYFLLMKSSYS